MNPSDGALFAELHRIELELVVHDVTAALRDHDADTLGRHLHADVVYRPALTRVAEGRETVVGLCAEIWTSFETFTVDIENVAVRGDVVMVEQRVTVGMSGTAPLALLGFASFRFRDVQIAEWRQIHA